ncbi:hypothetical protein P9869_04070 [Streptomyces ossamyceticus]|nr:hypothetical protein [Streptomyces ossamyceticus]
MLINTGVAGGSETAVTLDAAHRSRTTGPIHLIVLAAVSMVMLI